MRVTYLRTDQVSWSVGADGTTTVKDSETGWFFPLNEVASFVWDLLDGTATRDEILEEVVQNFDVPPEEASNDVDDFIEDALDLNLIEETPVADAPSSAELSAGAAI